jgi:hypothetical protein
MQQPTSDKSSVGSYLLGLECDHFGNIGLSRWYRVVPFEGKS